MVPDAFNSHELVYTIRQRLLGNFATARVDTWRALCAYTKRLSCPRCTILHRTSWCSNKSPSVPPPPLNQHGPTKRSSLQRARALDLSIAISSFFFLFSKPRIASVCKTGSTGRITTRQMHLNSSTGHHRWWIDLSIDEIPSVPRSPRSIRATFTTTVRESWWQNRFYLCETDTVWVQSPGRGARALPYLPYLLRILKCSCVTLASTHAPQRTRTHTHAHVRSVKRGWTRRGAEGWNGRLRRGRGEHDFLLESGVVCYFFAAQNGPFDVPSVYFDEAERFHYRSESVRFG